MSCMCQSLVYSCRRSQLSNRQSIHAFANKPSSTPPSIVGTQKESLVKKLRKLDACLATENVQDDEVQSQAISVIEHLKAEGAITAFGNGRQVPKRLYTLEELRLNKIESSQLLTPKDETLDTVQAQLQGACVTVALALGLSGALDVGQIGIIVVASLFLLTVDQVSYGGGARAIVLDSLGRIINPSYRQRITYHEAGHFLIAYLCGLLPIAYTLSSLDAFRSYGSLNVQAGCRFADAEFASEVASGKLTASSLERFTCVALAGVCSEYLEYGKAEGGLSDIMQLDSMLKALQFSQKKADGEIRWAVLNTISMLRTNENVHRKLAAAMESRASVGYCIALLETEFALVDDF